MIYKIEDVLEDIKNGIPLIIVDDENRENEGDLFVAAEKATYESINLMATYARGLTCTPMSTEYAVRLNLDPMTARNTDAKCTAFTVSVDAKEGTTTGISIADRFTTIKKLADINSVATDFTRPGHIFPLIAKDNGVLEREGHTEATVDLCKICGLAPVSVICEILKDDGTMARMDDLEVFAKEHNLKIITIADLIKYRKKTQELMKVEVVANMPTDNGTFKIVGFENHIDGKEHIALVKGDVAGKEGVTVRIHSECFTGDILGSLRCDCGSQLKTAMRRIDRLGEGVILYLRQEGRGIGLLNKLRAYNLQEEGMDTLDANLHLGFGADMRDYAVAAQMLKALGVKSIKLLTNNPLKIEGIQEYGMPVVEREEIEIEHNKVNKVYLKTKKERMGHLLKIK
ncbi:bifunctional 3,4-dihydroxy-2-butanone-4-phosphate synthase/GTP cyclohydrolase II [Fusobacterium pseudoperiodonticum]|uniref:Riboflavin biosynthesis protein RibBA n=1 Tax=Fusobacterium pseudoperiodonticum TaxID=2663009 RepID=A0AAD0F353_9FUSO|nr:bifunctional 3,4-dihydroxy-2-butanone-4-phosphate synthase/GTP cyclohydrolase II [Fusobacterium pseudoperiodonticum]ATV65380.1 bifunctional 3,4-dihydroxy-2-butanone-4-phosphate synthase/GTP cyclohydrolase II [Fusobacterium pseudoperiodonticum]